MNWDEKWAEMKRLQEEARVNNRRKVAIEAVAIQNATAALVLRAMAADMDRKVVEELLAETWKAVETAMAEMLKPSEEPKP